MKKAYDEVIDHSTENVKEQKVYRKVKLPHYVIGLPQENRENPKRVMVDIDIEVDPRDPPVAIKRRLLKVTRLAKGATTLQVARTQAWPRGLIHFGGLLGRAYLAADGRGWDGKGTKVRGVELLSEAKPAGRAPSELDLQVLRALERSRRLLLADPKYAKFQDRWTKRPALLERVVIAKVAPKLGFTVASVRDTVQNARKYWLRPTWQPLRRGRGQK